jgi:hypothetical protein
MKIRNITSRNTLHIGKKQTKTKMGVLYYKTKPNGYFPIFSSSPGTPGCDWFCITRRILLAIEGPPQEPPELISRGPWWFMKSNFPWLGRKLQ